jgi:hypothetical protein
VSDWPQFAQNRASAATGFSQRGQFNPPKDTDIRG